MKKGYSAQYDTPSVIVTDTTKTPQEVLDYAREIEAIYTNGDGDHFVVQLPDRGFPELYTERALRAGW